MNKPAAYLFDRKAIPKMDNPLLAFVRTVEVAVHEMEQSLVPEIDMTEGLDKITISGRIKCYKQIATRRVVELAKATGVLWNSNLELGALVTARALFETIVSFHAFLRKIEDAAEIKNYPKLAEIVDAFLLSTRVKSKIETQKLPKTTSILTFIENYAKRVEPLAMQYYEQVSDYCHPNGYAMMRKYGSVEKMVFKVEESGFDSADIFAAVYNAVYQICWFYTALGELDKVTDQIQYLD